MKINGVFKPAFLDKSTRLHWSICNDGSDIGNLTEANLNIYAGETRVEIFEISG